MEAMHKRRKIIASKGKGCCGEVKKYRNSVTGETVVIKKIPFNDNRCEGVDGSLIREVSLLKELEHDNIVRLLDVLCKKDSVDLVFEHLDCDLQQYLERKVILSTSKKKVFLHQILCGLEYCHSMKILHRDLKPRNLLIGHGNDRVKIAGFGVAMAVDVPLEAYTHRLGTPQYMAPEALFRYSKYSFPADVWSVACIFAEMFTNQHLFPSEGGWNVKNQLLKILSIMGTPNQETWPYGWNAIHNVLGYVPTRDAQDLSKHIPGLDKAGVDLLNRMLCLDASKRITAHKALKHEYFRNVPSVP